MEADFYCGLTVGCVLVSALVVDTTRHVRAAERERRGWCDYASGRGLCYSCRSTTWSLLAHHRIEGRVRGVPLSLGTGLGAVGMPMTTVKAVTAVPIEGRLYVSCPPEFSRALRDVEAQRIEVADPDFNGRVFLVHATAPQLARVVLVRSVRETLLRMGAIGVRSVSFRCDREEIAVEWLGHEAVPDVFDLGCDVVVGACQSRGRVGAYR